MQNKTEHSNIDLKKETPLLNQLKSQNNFKTPDSYFDDLPNAIVSKISNNKSSIWSKFYLTWAIPSITIILLGWVLLNQINAEESIDLEISSIEFYAELIAEEDDFESAIIFDEPNISFADFEYIEEEEFNYELPIETDELDLNILFN